MCRNSKKKRAESRATVKYSIRMFVWWRSICRQVKYWINIIWIELLIMILCCCFFSPLKLHKQIRTNALQLKCMKLDTIPTGIRKWIDKRLIKCGLNRTNWIIPAQTAQQTAMFPWIVLSFAAFPFARQLQAPISNWKLLRVFTHATTWMHATNQQNQCENVPGFRHHLKCLWLTCKVKKRERKKQTNIRKS